MKKFNFPIITRVRIKHFSLYKKAEFLDIDLKKNVFCLAGANGLGKSTFITILNYGLTGIVKNPDRRFTQYNEIPKFYNQSKGFAATYFDGRVSETDYDLAEVMLDFTIGEFQYTITRGFFEPDELRDFTKIGAGVNLSTDQLSHSEINDLYKTHFTKDVKLAQFDQFVFLQSYVFTFDETHQLLFWDESLMERVLYLFFGVDAEKAKTADRLRKEINKSDSDAKNLQWQITKARNELESIKKKMQIVDVNNATNIELFETHKSLIEASDDLNEKIDRVRADIKDCDLNISDFSLKSNSLRSEYEYIFNQSLKEDTPIERNPKVVSILNDLKLRIYTSKGFQDLLDQLVDEIKFEFSVVNGKSPEEYFEQLKVLDLQLSEVSKEINNFQSRKNRLIEQEKEFLVSFNITNDKIEKIQKDNDDLLKSIHNLKNNKEVNAVIKSYEDVIAQYSTQKDESYQKRNKARNDLDVLEKELSLGYVDAESLFIPAFNEYAKNFLGLDINVQLTSSSKGASLSLIIEDSKRKDSFQLSESQRYFIDIALRMALIELSASSATFLVDTPEGSLDIAYESRAGKMLADFSKVNHHLIMTANINSSQLLVELATICKTLNMKVERMTNWTTLSDVQQQESLRIEQAFAKIEETLETESI
jgi:hypothetical protein